jgi:hypothetical protein
LREGNSFLIESTTSTVLAFGWRSTAIAIDRSPFAEAKVFTSSKLS